MRQIADLVTMMARENPGWGYTQIHIPAADFFNVEVWGLRGLVTFYVLLVIEHSSRRVHFAGSTPNPNTEWMMQIARNLTDPSIKEECLSKMVFFGERSLCRAIEEYLAHYHALPSPLQPIHL